jgi:hypothetical protein
MKTVMIPPMITAAKATWDTSVPGAAAHQMIAARLASTSWIHEPAAVTQRRARSSGKVQASFTLQKKAGSKYMSMAQLVNGNDDRAGYPEDRKGSEIEIESVEIHQSAGKLRPLEGENEEVHGEERHRYRQKATGKEEPEPGEPKVEQLVRVAHRPAQTDQVALKDAIPEPSAALGPEPFHPKHRTLAQRTFTEPHGSQLGGEGLNALGRHPQSLVRKCRRRLGCSVLAIQHLHDHHFYGTESKVFAGFGVFDDVALFAPIGLLHQDEVATELGMIGHGAVWTTFSPGARPLRTSIRSPSSSLPSVIGRSVVRSSVQTRAYPS